MTISEQSAEEMVASAPAVREGKHEPEYLRWPLSDRIEHIITIASFTILAATGLPQRYSTLTSMQWLIDSMGGIETVRVIHRVAALVLILASIWHVMMMGYKIYVKRVRLTMLPGWADVQHAIQVLGYNVRLFKNPPQMGKYNYAEKAEYWALVWGTGVMMVTGYMLWNPIATTNIFPGQFIPVARTAHSMEAILAVLSILTWHLYHVHLKRFNKSMFTGYMGREEMEEEHALELELIDEGQAVLRSEGEEKRRRARRYVPVAAVITLMLFAATFYYLTYEQTAILTIPTPEPGAPAQEAGTNWSPTPVPPAVEAAG
jgi:formate dehydrogenase gamma subunit